jgi:ATP-dependent helicase/nuclease subunit B
VRADRMILAGLEEGVWPNAAPTDPFLSRPMRAALGLPPPERRLGQTAQDFVQAACAAEAILVHSRAARRAAGGQVALAVAAGDADPRRRNAPATPVGPRCRSGRRGSGANADVPLPGPRATPGVRRRRRPWFIAPAPVAGHRRRALGPRSLRRLRPAHPRPAEARPAWRARPRPWPAATPFTGPSRRRGQPGPTPCPTTAPTRSKASCARSWTPPASPDHAMARETGRWPATAPSGLAWERERRARGATLLIEQTGTMTFDAPFGPFTLTAKADRDRDSTPPGPGPCDRLQDRRGAVGEADRQQGFSPSADPDRWPSWPAGSGTPKADAGDLTYLRVTGRKPPGEEIVRKTAGEEPASRPPPNAYERGCHPLVDCVAAYQDPSAATCRWHRAAVHGNFAGDYDHLARVFEWSYRRRGRGRRMTLRPLEQARLLPERRAADPDAQRLRHRQRRVGQDQDPDRPGGPAAAAKVQPGRDPLRDLHQGRRRRDAGAGCSRLGGWSVMDDEALPAKLLALEGRDPTAPATPCPVRARKPVRQGAGDAGRAEDPDHPRLLRKAAAPVSPSRPGCRPASP